MGLASLPSPSEGMFILLLVNTASSFAMVKELFRIILHALGIHLPSDCDPCSAAWSSPAAAAAAASPDPCRTRVSYTQQLIDDFRCRSPPIRFEAVAYGAVQQECSVCLSHFEPESKINKLGCGHLFHNVCLEKWLNYWNTTCPLCRTTVMPLEEDPETLTASTAEYGKTYSN